MAGPDDDELGPKLAAGQEDAFAALYDRYGVRLYRTACALLDNRHDAEDAVQAVFLSLVRHRSALARVKNWLAYLLTSLRHETARLATQRRRRQDYQPIAVMEAFASPEKRAANDLGELEDALAQLPAEQRQAIRLKIDAGLTFVQIGALLQISPNTAASRYRYAIDKLRQLLRD